MEYSFTIIEIYLGLLTASVVGALIGWAINLFCCCSSSKGTPNMPRYKMPPPPAKKYYRIGVDPNKSPTLLNEEHTTIPFEAAGGIEFTVDRCKHCGKFSNLKCE